MPHAYVELLEFFECDGIFYRSSFVVGCLVSLLGLFKLVELFLYCLVFNLFEQQFGFIQLVTLFQYVCCSKVVPVALLYVQHAAQALAAERQERFEGYGEVCHELQRHI